MIRFSAPEEEIASLMRFIMRRAGRLGESAGAGDHIVLAPLEADNRDELRFRRTPRPLIARLKASDAPTEWGLRAARDDRPRLVASRNGNGRLHVNPEASRLIVLQLGPAQGAERRRDALLEARDWVGLDAANLSPEEAAAAAQDTEFARRLVERCTRRIRRRGTLAEGRWRIGA